LASGVPVVFEPQGKKLEISSGITVLQSAIEAGVGIRSECGGKGICGKCKIAIKNADAVSKVTKTERKILSQSEINSGIRLACQTKIQRPVTVMVLAESRFGSSRLQVLGLERKAKPNPSVKKFHIVMPKPTLFDATPDFERLLAASAKCRPNDDLQIDHELLKTLPDSLRGSNWDVTVTLHDNKIIAIEPGDTTAEMFGFALDIGTSKIAGCLVDLRSGETVATGAIENPQVIYGEDILTRITFAMANKTNVKTLQKLAVEAANKVLQSSGKVDVDSNKIYEVVVVGNTAMHHFFLGIQPKYLALSPYVPAIKRSINLPAKELHLKVNKRAITTILPNIAGFVGADAVADVLTTGIQESKNLSLLIDVGTNTEVFLGNSEDVLCCSCASGPAFEGGHIKHGMKALTGAIEKVRISSEIEVEYETIDDARPGGLCGSAVIDVVAEMLRNKIINRFGRFDSKRKIERFKRSNDVMEFVVAESAETATGKDVTITQKDVNETQLAKSAIYTGCSILMKRKNIEKKRINRVFIAGAFGNYLNPGNAKLIGLIPDVPTEKIRFVGNTALSGAKSALISKKMRKKATQIANSVRYLELANDPDFNFEFSKALLFP